MLSPRNSPRNTYNKDVRKGITNRIDFLESQVNERQNSLERNMADLDSKMDELMEILKDSNEAA